MNIAIIQFENSRNIATSSIRNEIGVREHHPLRTALGSAGITDGRESVWGWRHRIKDLTPPTFLKLLEREKSRLREASVQTTHQFAQRIQRDNQWHILSILRYFFDFTLIRK